MFWHVSVHLVVLGIGGLHAATVANAVVFHRTYNKGLHSRS